METFHLIAPKVIFSLGILNIVTAALIFLSCRCTAGSKLGSQLMKHHAFKRLHKGHCYIWPVFGVSVTAHMILAIQYLGIPF